MYDKIYIIDFDDSFTYNIANVLFSYEPNIKVISHLDFFDQRHFNDFLKVKNKIGIVLGPGPGHPNDYCGYFEKIQLLRKKDLFFIVGVCLGHQILAMLDGFEIRDSLQKVHGMSELMVFKNYHAHVMRYNSLAVFHNNKELNLREGRGFISYQFHPESVGSTNSIMFFQSLLDFIKEPIGKI